MLYPAVVASTLLVAVAVGPGVAGGVDGGGAQPRRRAGDFYLRGRAAGGFGGRRRTDLLTTQTPRRKQAAQSAATHRVGTRAGEALCGLSAAAAITVAGHLGCLLVRKGGEGKRPRWPGLRESSAFDC